MPTRPIAAAVIAVALIGGGVVAAQTVSSDGATTAASCDPTPVTSQTTEGTVVTSTCTVPNATVTATATETATATVTATTTVTATPTPAPVDTPAPVTSSAAPTPSVTPTTATPSPTATATTPAADPFFIGASTVNPRETGHRTYYTLGSTTAVSDAKADETAGRTPVQSFKLPTGSTWADAAAGKLDAQFKTLAQSLNAAATSRPIYVAVHHEPEGDGTMSDWTAMQAHLAPIFNLPNLRYSIILQGYPELYGSTAYRLDTIWPKGAPVKALGVDVYQSRLVASDKWTNLTTAYWVKFGAWAKTNHVQWFEGEAGISDVAWTTPEAADWFAQNIKGIRDNGGQGFLYFDHAGADAAHSWPLTGTKKTAFLTTLP